MNTPNDLDNSIPLSSFSQAALEQAPMHQAALEQRPMEQSIVVAAEESGAALNAFENASNFATGQRIAIALSRSSLIPKEYQNNIPNCLIAIELASRIKASVFMVMQSLDIIHGRPSWRASFLIATVNACGRFTPMRFRWEGKSGDDTWGCRAVAKDRETGEECIGALITIQLAKAEGWYGKSGSKWKTIPDQMCMYRAASFWTRVYAPELSLGMQTAEDVRDVDGPVVEQKTKALEQELLDESKAKREREPGEEG